MDPATGRNITSQTISRRKIPEAHVGPRGDRELDTFVNHGTPMVHPAEPVSQEGYGLSAHRARTFFVQNNLAFSIFVFMFIVVFCFLILAFFNGFSNGVNAFLMGTFKRPLPKNPELYFDMNCINSMNLADMLQTDQIQQCRGIRNIDRPGPVWKF